MDTLSNKLKSLGVKVGAKDLPRPTSKSVYSIDHVVEGRFQATNFGDAFFVENLYDSEYRHGNGSLSVSASLHNIVNWGNINHLAESEPGAFVFLDTETTGLSGGTGTYAFMVGVGRFSGDHFQLVQFFMRDPTEEPAMLAALKDFLHPSLAIVTYNGKAFDAPLLNTRYTLQGITSPLPTLAHLDLLPLARRLWRDRLPSRTLSYVETSILGAVRSQEEVPGWMIPQLYFDYLRSGDARSMAGVFYHNAMDILSLAALFSHTCRMLADPLEMEIEESLDLVAIARLFEELGYLDSSEKMYRLGLEMGLPEPNFWDTVQRLALLHRRRHEWQAAVDLWIKAAQNGYIYAHVELAKYFEHDQRNPADALYWTQAALVIVNSSSFPPYLRKQILPELEHRLARLLRKLS